MSGPSEAGSIGRRLEMKPTPATWRPHRVSGPGGVRSDARSAQVAPVTDLVHLGIEVRQRSKALGFGAAVPSCGLDRPSWDRDDLEPIDWMRGLGWGAV
jgi:hypothetical protein